MELTIFFIILLLELSICSLVYPVYNKNGKFYDGNGYEISKEEIDGSNKKNKGPLLEKTLKVIESFNSWR